MDFMARIQQALTRIREIYTSLKNRRNEIDSVDIGQDPNPQMWAFQVHFKGSGYSLSIAVPIDMLYGYCETALFSGGNLIYRDEWGYSDIVRLSDTDDLVKEIQRVGKLAQAEKKQP